MICQIVISKRMIQAWMLIGLVRWSPVFAIDTCQITKQLTEHLQQLKATRPYDLIVHRTPFVQTSLENLSLDTESLVEAKLVYALYKPTPYLIRHPSKELEQLYFRTYSKNFASLIKDHKQIVQFLFHFDPDSKIVTLKHFKQQSAVPHRLFESSRVLTEMPGLHHYPDEVNFLSSAKEDAQFLGIYKQQSIKTMFRHYRGTVKQIMKFDTRSKQSNPNAAYLAQFVLPSGIKVVLTYSFLVKYKIKTLIIFDILQDEGPFLIRPSWRAQLLSDKPKLAPVFKDPRFFDTWDHRGSIVFRPKTPNHPILKFLVNREGQLYKLNFSSYSEFDFKPLLRNAFLPQTPKELSHYQKILNQYGYNIFE